MKNIVKILKENYTSANNLQQALNILYFCPLTKSYNFASSLSHHSNVLCLLRLARKHFTTRLDTSFNQKTSSQTMLTPDTSQLNQAIVWLRLRVCMCECAKATVFTVQVVAMSLEDHGLARCNGKSFAELTVEQHIRFRVS